jgi:hypothetical protein
LIAGRHARDLKWLGVLPMGIHFKSMEMKKIIPLLMVLAAGPLSAQAIVGSWLVKGAGEARSTAILTFLPNGVYVMAEDGDSKLDPSGKDGIERGTYKWNAKTNAFSSKTLVDTSGEWGLSDGSIKSVSVAGNTLTLGGIRFTKVTSKSDKLIGSWFIKDGTGYAVATFLADGSYFMVQDKKASGGGRTGLERGTYKWNSSNKSFTRKVSVDTNGTWGFSDEFKRTLLVSGNRLTLNVIGEGKFTLSRVIAP